MKSTGNIKVYSTHSIYFNVYLEKAQQWTSIPSMMMSAWSNTFGCFSATETKISSGDVGLFTSFLARVEPIQGSTHSYHEGKGEGEKYFTFHIISDFYIIGIAIICIVFLTGKWR